MDSIDQQAKKEIVSSYSGIFSFATKFLLVAVGVAVFVVASRIQSPSSQSKITPNFLRSYAQQQQQQYDQKSSRRNLQITPRIVGGEAAYRDEFPFIVALYRTTDINNDREPTCGGSLITPNVVMTAGHCIGNFQRIEINRYRQSDDRDVDRYFSFEQRINPNYNPKIIDYDVGLIKLPTPQLTAAPISLATEGTEIPATIKVMGWGQLSLDGNQPDTLQQVSLSSVPQDECQADYDHFTITDRMFCAAGPGKDACLGDSGGPAIIDGHNIQVGVVSWGIGCADGSHPGVYARVSALHSWIEETVCTDLSPGDCVQGKLPNYAVNNDDVSLAASVTAQPSVEATASPSYQTVSPTSAPTLVITEAPTLVITEAPTPLPKKAYLAAVKSPKDHSAKIFSSDAPSQSPSIKPPTSMPTHTPTTTKTSNPTPKPTSKPTQKPSLSPAATKKPNAKRYTFSQDPKCRDRQGNFLQLHGSTKRLERRGCNWVAEDTIKRCPLFQQYCPHTCQVKRCQKKQSSHST